MKILLLTLFTLALSVMPLHPSIATSLPSAGRSWNEIDLLLAVIVFIFYMYTIYRRGEKVSLSTMPLSVFLSLALILTTQLSFAQPINLSEVLRLLMVILLIPFIEYLITSFGWKKIAYISLSILILHGQWGVAQFIMQRDMGHHVLGETRLSQSDTIGVANFNYDENTKIIRGYGPYAHPNILAGSLVISLLFIVLLVVSAQRKRSRRYMNCSDSRNTSIDEGRDPHSGHICVSPIYLSIMFLAILGILATFSRAAMLSVALCIPILFTYKNRISIKLIKFFTLVLLLLTIVFSPLLIKRSIDPSDVAAPERFTGYTWMFDVLSETTNWQHIGPGQYEKVLATHLDKKNITHSDWQIAPVHSTPLLFTAEWGILGLAAMLLMIIGTILEYGLKKTKKYLLWILPILPPLLLDHYFLTQTAPLVWLLVLLMIYRQSLLLDPLPYSKSQSFD